MNFRRHACPRISAAALVLVLFCQTPPLTHSFSPNKACGRRLRWGTVQQVETTQIQSRHQVARYLFNFVNEAESEKQTIESNQKPSGLDFWRRQKNASQESANTSQNNNNNVVNNIVESTTKTNGMPGLASFMKRTPIVNNAQESSVTTTSTSEEESLSHSSLLSSSALPAVDVKTLGAGFAAILLTAIVSVCASFGLSFNDVLDGAQALVSNPQASLQKLLDFVESAGSAAPVYFGALYFLAEILAVPATPLALSAGFLFGTTNGVFIVLVAATMAACFGFFVGKTVLRGTVENILRENPKFAKLDRAVGEKGLPLLLLVRLTPIFPFSISNYVYGASSINFADYFWGTLLGFIPGTIAYVYVGEVGQALTTGEGSQPWYVYVAGIIALVGILSLVTNVATNIVEALEDEED